MAKPAAAADSVRYVALLRGVMPTNLKMPALKRCFEAAGFTDVATVLASGNVVFTGPRATASDLEARATAAMTAHLDRVFPVLVRTGAALAALLASDPWSRFALAPDAKRVVTFLPRPVSPRLALPEARDGVQILATTGTEVFTAYTPHPKGPVFMTMLEKAFGKDVTTRTWDTVAKLVRAAGVG